MKRINKELARQILKRVEADQRMRERFMAGKAKWNKEIDRENTAWLKGIVKEYGWPTVSLVGKKASHGAWLLVQHADHDLRFQKNILKMLETILQNAKGEVSLANIAYLTDRVLIHEKKKQLFGTQSTRNNKSGGFEPFPIKDRENVNKRRKQHGLPSLEAQEKRINKEYKDFPTRS